MFGQKKINHDSWKRYCIPTNLTNQTDFYAHVSNNPHKRIGTIGPADSLKKCCTACTLLKIDILQPVNWFAGKWQLLMPTNHTCKLAYTLPQGVSKVHFVEVVPDGLQKCDHQDACIARQKQACQWTSPGFEMYNEGCKGWTVPQALSRFMMILEMTSRWSTQQKSFM